MDLTNAVDFFPHIWNQSLFQLYSCIGCCFILLSQRFYIPSKITYSLLIALFFICTNESYNLSEWTDISEEHPLTLDSCSRKPVESEEAFPTHTVSNLGSTEQLQVTHFTPLSFCSCGFGRVLPFPGWKGLLQRPRNNKFQSWYVALKVQLVFAFKVLPTFIYTEHCNRAETTPSVYVWE